MDGRLQGLEYHVVATPAERARLYFRFHRPRILLAADPEQELKKRHLLTLFSDDWRCWADGHQLIFFIAEDDLRQTRFGAAHALDG